MGDSVQIPWELSGHVVNPLDAAAAGLAQGQRVGALRALHGLDINNPDTFGPVTNALAHVGALDQASGIYALQGARLKNSILNAGFQAYGDLIKGNSPSSQAQPSAVGEDGTVDYGALTGDQKVHMLQSFSQIDQIEANISRLPYAERKAALQQAAAPLIARGLDRKLVDDFDPTDENIAAMLARHDQARTAILNPGSTAEPAAAPAAATPAAPAAPTALTPAGTAGAPGGAPAPVSPSPEGGSGIDLRDPHTQGTIGMLGLAGLDVAPMIQMGTAVIPNYTAGSGGVLFNPKTGAQLPGHVGQNLSNVNGQMVDLNDPHNSGRSVPAPPEGGRVLYDNQGNPIVVPVQGYQGVAAGVAGAVAGGRAAGEAAGRAPADLVTVNMSDGSTQQGTFEPGPDGSYSFRPIQGGASGGGVGHSPSPQQTDVNKASGVQLANDKVLASNAQTTMVPLRKVYDLLPTTNIGPGAEQVNALRSFVISQAPILASVTPGGIDMARLKAANFDEVKKYMVQIAGASAAQYGQGTDQKMAIAASGNPNVNMTNLPARDVVRMNIGLLRAQQAKVALYNGSPEGYADYAAHYARTVDPRAFMLDLLTRKERAGVLSSITTAADKRAFLAGKQAAEDAKIFSEADIPR